MDTLNWDTLRNKTKQNKKKQKQKKNEHFTTKNTRKNLSNNKNNI